MSWFLVDVEADGPVPGLFSMYSIGIVKLDRKLATTYYGEFAPISEQFQPEALAVFGGTREKHISFCPPAIVTLEMFEWVRSVNGRGNPTFVSDNPAFDWQFVNFYAWKFFGRNPFGFSARRIGDMHAGLVKNAFAKGGEWKRFRKTAHTHHPVDDAKGNAEALLKMAELYNFHIPVED